jgi:pilus assembly protein Flp/PilA
MLRKDQNHSSGSSGHERSIHSHSGIPSQLIEDEQGQDLVEYALVVALIAFGAIAGMGYLAKGINHAFSGIATTLTANV